jgi:hypothetical protein
MRTACLCLILVCATSLSPAQAAPEGGAATAIRALEHEWFDGQSSRNNGALDLLFDNELVYVEYGRLVTKGDYLSRVKVAEPGASQVVMEAMTVRMFGDTAVTVGTYYEKNISGNNTHPKRWRFVDTWVFKRGRWMLVAAAAAPLSNS